MVKKKEMQQNASCCFSACGFKIESASELTVEAEYNLVKGKALKVINPSGEVIHEGVRGFMLVNDTYHLIRREDGSWWHCLANGQPKKKSALCKKNLIIGSLALMFDERGKLRLGQQNARYPMLVLR